MSERVRILDNALVDQIAAGEVVERPASIVKELVENALDAGATRIQVEIEEGGTRRITVSDDGHGMSRGDATLAILRHATSKIRSTDDLMRIRTLGFRGEALPSIASVSRFRLTTREPESDTATRIAIEGGGAPEVRDAGAATGTTIEARELFYNVPARKKFLKSRSTESGHIHDVCFRAILARPDVRLLFVRDGRRVLDIPRAESIAERVRQAFERESLTEIRASRDGVEVHALLGAPEAARSGAGSLHLYVNGRPVRDRALARAVAFAYGSVLPPGRYPAGAVFVTVPEADVDVNVHPQKAEVRFARGGAVYDALTRALAGALGTAAWTQATRRSATFWTHRLEPAPEGASHASAPAYPTAPERPPATDPNAGADPWGLAASLHDGASVQRSMDASGFFTRLRVVGQVHRMLIVCEDHEHLHLIDQHAADERIRFHRLRTGFEAADIRKQALLFPERVEVSAEEAAWLEAHTAELDRLGFEGEMLGDRTFAVRTVPAVVANGSPKRLFGDVLAEGMRHGDRHFADGVDTALATLACHSAIRAGDTLTLEECIALVRALDGVPFEGHCPHGRPVAHTIDFRGVERGLGR
ncbi:MAG: DNA mismatch repair endonuclease MutL [Polyangiales bacterium]